jgi:hypothetical protein
LYGPLPVTGIGQLSLPYQNPVGLSVPEFSAAVATAGLEVAWFAVARFEVADPVLA